MEVTQRFEGLEEEIREGFGEDIVALRRDIHRDPELGFDTEKTAEKVLDALDGLPLEIQTGIAQNGVVAARALCQDHLRERLSGTVKFVFQPAEEGYAGGRAMVEEGVAEEVRQIFALHLWPGLEFGVAATKAGPIMAASDAFEIEVKGSGGHGAMPHLTTDAVAIATQT